MSTGATPACAASVTASGRTSSRGPGQGLGQGPGEEQDPRRCRHGEAEAHRLHEERIGHHQRSHGQGEDAHAAGPATEGDAETGQSGHRRRSQHRGLEARDGGEHHQQRHRGRQPRPPPETFEQRTRHDEHEGHVLSGHDEKVLEAGGVEVVGHLHGLATVVAQHETQEQRPLIGGQGLGPTAQQGPHAVGQPGERPARFPLPHLLDHQAAHDVSGREPRQVAHRLDPSDDLDTLAGGAVGQPGSWRTTGPGLEAPIAGDHLDPPAVRGRLGVAGERDGPAVRPALRRLHAGPCLGRERARQHRAGHPQQRHPT